MDAPTLIHPPAGAAADPARTSTAGIHPQCDECGTAVAPEQRYCVACGAHRRNVDDPAARYLSGASALTRRVASASTAGTPAMRSRGVGLATALVLAAIPVAAGLGVVAGRSSSNGDASLVRALSHQSAADNALLSQLSSQGSGSGATGTAAGSSAGSGGGSKTKQKSGKGHRAKAAKASTGAVSSGAASLSTSKPSTAQVQSGASAVKKIQQSSGKGYVNSQSGLPGTIVVP